MKKAVAGLLLALGLAGCGGHQASWHEGYRPCPTEDSVGCYWDAHEQGNGVGRSFVVTPEGEVHYR